MITDIEKSDWYQSLVDDCRSIITEAVFISRFALIEGYHLLGERVVNEEHYKEWHAKGNYGYLKSLSNNIGISERRLYSAIQFYQKYPSLDALPEGKNISWTKILTKYLPAQAGDNVLLPIILEYRQQFPPYLWGVVNKLASMNGNQKQAAWHLQEFNRLYEEDVG